MKTTDIFARTKLALGIEPDPPVRPITVPPTANQPSAPILDQTKVTSILERARTASVAQTASAALATGAHDREAAPPRATQPQLIKRRVEIMITGSLSRVGVVRSALEELQTGLFRQLGSDNLELRVTAFLDGCRHTTPWSHSPIDVGGNTNYWHCFQGGTRYAEAFRHTGNEADPVDAVIMFGNRFDDDLRQCLAIAEQLRAQGTRIYALHVRGNARTRHAYEQLAARTGGAFVQLSNHRAFAGLMPVIADYLVRPGEALQALPPPRYAEVRDLIERLKLQPPPPALRLAWRKP